MKRPNTITRAWTEPSGEPQPPIRPLLISTSNAAAGLPLPFVMIEHTPMIELLAQVRPQWLSAVNDAWFNWRFAVGLLIPPCLFFVTTGFRWGGLLSFPFAAAGFWLFISIGIYNVSDVMAESAVTDDEMDLACADTGRTFAPILAVPPASFVYTLLSLGGVIFVRAVFQRREKPDEASCPNWAG